MKKFRELLGVENSDIGDAILNELTAKTSWKPKFGDRYWYVDIDAFVETIWTDRVFDYYLFYCGNCFETPKKLLDKYHNP